MGLFVDDRTVPADLHCLATVTLVVRDEFHAAVAVPVDVPIHERRNTMASLVFSGKWPSRVVRPLLRCPEQRFGVRNVYRHPWYGEGPQDSKFLQPALQRGGSHGVTDVGVQQQGLLAGLAQPLADACPAHQIRCVAMILTFGDAPGDNIAAPQITP